MKEIVEAINQLSLCVALQGIAIVITLYTITLKKDQK